MGIEAAIASTVVSSVVAANGARAVGKAQQAANNYNADINERNALANEQDAVQLKIASQLDIARFRREFSDLQDATVRHLDIMDLLPWVVRH